MAVPAYLPSMKEDLFGDGQWLSVHNRFAADAKEKEPEVVFIGDSLIAYLQYTVLWDNLFEPMHALNFGVGGERTEHVLWRILNGEMDNMKPKAVVLLVGTNNHGCTAEDVSEGILAIVDVIREKQPETEIVVLALLPRGEKPNLLRDRNSKVNEILLERVKSKDKTQLLNIDPGLVLPDGSISHHDLWDYLHLTKSGYEKCFEPVHELLSQILSEDST